MIQAFMHGLLRTVYADWQGCASFLCDLTCNNRCTAPEPAGRCSGAGEKDLTDRAGFARCQP